MKSWLLTHHVIQALNCMLALHHVAAKGPGRPPAPAAVPWPATAPAAAPPCLPKLVDVEQRLQQAVHVASGALVLEPNIASLLARVIQQVLRRPHLNNHLHSQAQQQQ